MHSPLLNYSIQTTSLNMSNVIWSCNWPSISGSFKFLNTVKPKTLQRPVRPSTIPPSFPLTLLPTPWVLAHPASASWLSFRFFKHSQQAFHWGILCPFLSHWFTRLFSFHLLYLYLIVTFTGRSSMTSLHKATVHPLPFPSSCILSLSLFFILHNT